jgi:hypothetical protein
MHLQHLKDALESSCTTTTYIHLIIPKNGPEIQQQGELFNGIMKIRIHSPSDNLAAYVEQSIQSVTDYNIDRDVTILSSHYHLEFWISNKQLKSIISKQRDGHMSIQKVPNGQIIVEVSNGGQQATKIRVPENSNNVVSINLYPGQIIYSIVKLAAISEFIHTIDPPSGRLCIKTHMTEPPILSYVIENVNKQIACYIDMRVPQYAQAS